MADAVTYADLRFAEISQQEMKLDDALEENTAEDGDAMYENVTCPPRVRTEPAAPPTGAGERLRTGFRARAPLLSLLLSLLSLILMASTIGLAVKYIHLSRQFHHLSVNHKEQNSSFAQRLQKMETDMAATENSLERSREEKEEMVWGIRHLNTSLLEYKQMADEKEATEERLKKAESQIQEWEKGFCPENWILFGKKCLFKSEEQKTWEESKRYCEAMSSNLIVVEQGDAEIQNFTLETQKHYWVGKVLRPKGYKNEWEWPSSYEVYWKNWNKCWRINGGRLVPEDCWKQSPCICEKNLVMLSLNENSYSSFSIWNTNYKCKVMN